MPDKFVWACRVFDKFGFASQGQRGPINTQKVADGWEAMRTRPDNDVAYALYLPLGDPLIYADCTPTRQIRSSIYNLLAMLDKTPIVITVPPAPRGSQFGQNRWTNSSLPKGAPKNLIPRAGNSASNFHAPGAMSARSG